MKAIGDPLARALGHERLLSGRQRKFDGAPLSVANVPKADIRKSVTPHS